MSDYDNWLLQQADNFMTGCKPRAVGVHQEPADGEIMSENVYNCEDCEDATCEHWSDYNENRAEQDEALLWGI